MMKVEIYRAKNPQHVHHMATPGYPAIDEAYWGTGLSKNWAAPWYAPFHFNVDVDDEVLPKPPEFGVQSSEWVYSRKTIQ